MSLDRLLEDLLLERHGPVVHDAERIPHLPLWLYRENWREEVHTDVDLAAIEAFELRRERQAERDFQRRTERKQERQLRVLSDEEAEAV